jgi:hypothetical protein
MAVAVVVAVWPVTVWFDHVPLATSLGSIVGKAFGTRGMAATELAKARMAATDALVRCILRI